MPTQIPACHRDGNAVFFDAPNAAPTKVADCPSQELAERVAFWGNLQLDAQRRGYRSLGSELDAFAGFAAAVQDAYRINRDPALGAALLTLTEAGACQIRKLDAVKPSASPRASVKQAQELLQEVTGLQLVETTSATAEAEAEADANAPPMYEIEPEPEEEESADEQDEKGHRRPMVGEDRFEEVKGIVQAAIKAAPKQRLTFAQLVEVVAAHGVGPTRLRSWLPRMAEHSNDPSRTGVMGGRRRYFWHLGGQPTPTRKPRAKAPAADKVGSTLPSTSVAPLPAPSPAGVPVAPGVTLRHRVGPQSSLFASLGLVPEQGPGSATSAVVTREEPLATTDTPQSIAAPADGEREVFDQAAFDRYLCQNQHRLAVDYHMRTTGSKRKAAREAVDTRIYEIVGEDRLDMEARP